MMNPQEEKKCSDALDYLKKEMRTAMQNAFQKYPQYIRLNDGQVEWKDAQGNWAPVTDFSKDEKPSIEDLDKITTPVPFLVFASCWDCGYFNQGKEKCECAGCEAKKGIHECSEKIPRL